MSFESKIRTVVDEWQRNGWLGVKAVVRYKVMALTQRAAYRKWILANALDDKDRERLRASMRAFPRNPLISIILPVYDIDEKWLRLCLESVLRQIYENWELCIADDCSTQPHVRRVLEEFRGKNERIKVVYREENGHISAASNSALELVTGEFTVLLDHDDELSEDALYYVAREINDFPEASMIYSDEDLISSKGKRYGPKFKPDFSRDLFYSANLITHLSAYKTRLLRKIGGFTVGLEGSQDYDLALRVIEQIPESEIRHIPRILYHWRVIESSVSAEGNAKPYAYDNARKAITAHFQRTGKKADVVETVHNLNRVRYRIPDERPLVSLIMSFNQNDRDAAKRISSFAAKTRYENFEIVAVSGVPLNPPAADAIQKSSGDGIPIRTVEFASGSKAEMLNEGASNSLGEILCFVDPSLVPDSPDWLEELVGFAIQDEIGAVGARVLYPDGTIIHGGLLIGVGGTVCIAHHGWPGERDGNITRTRLIGNYAAVSSSCMAVRRDLFLQAGMFAASRFPNDLFDVDLCLRLGQKDRRIVWTPYAGLTGTSSARDRTRFSNPGKAERANFESDWMRFIEEDPFYNPNLSRESGDFFIGL